MGQQVAALVFGVEVKHNLLRDEDGAWLDGEPEFRLETGDSDNFSCIGIPVAVQDVPEDNEVDLPEGPLDTLDGKLRSEIASVKKDWKEVVAWAKKHKVALPPPSLMLVIIERA